MPCDASDLQPIKSMINYDEIYTGLTLSTSIIEFYNLHCIYMYNDVRYLEMFSYRNVHT